MSDENRISEVLDNIRESVDGENPADVMVALSEFIAEIGTYFDVSKYEFLGKVMTDISTFYDDYADNEEGEGLQ